MVVPRDRSDLLRADTGSTWSRDDQDRAAGSERASPGVTRVPARINQILQEVLAEAIERLADVDERFGLLTVTAVQCEPGLRHAVVLFSSLGDADKQSLEEVRVRLQAAVSSQVRLRRTPQLSFAADPAIATGQHVEDILRDISISRPPEAPASADPPGEPGLIVDPNPAAGDRADPDTAPGGTP